MKKLVLIAGSLLALTGIVMGSEEAPAEHKKWMKDLGAQMGAMRKGVDVQKNAEEMQATLREVGKWWKARNSEIATESCRNAFKGAAAIAKAGDDKAAIAEGMKMVGAGCKGCHDPHREKISDTEYKIK